MLKHLTFAAALAALLMSAPLSAHDMWTDAVNPRPGTPFRLVVGYGHHYPTLEAIPAEELPYFQIKLIGPEGEIPVTADPASNYSFVSDEPVAAGSYIAVSDVKPVFWSQVNGEWVMKPRNEAKGATSCGHYIENAKGIVNVGRAGNDTLVTSPVGLPIEIVPGVNPAAAEPGSAIPLTVLLNGQPLRGAEVTARYAGFDKLTGSADSKAFYGVTGTDGKLNFVPLVAGEWIVTVRSEEPYKDKAACDKTDYGTSLHFTLK